MPRSHDYSCYDLAIRSTIEIPEMLPLAGAPKAPDVTIVQDAVDPEGLEGGVQIGPFLWASPDTVQLHVPDVARFRISGGETIVFDPATRADADSIRVFMLGSALGALLFQRGHLVLHGNAIEIGDACMVCVGASGAGKSTLAAAFMQRGYRLIADDVVPLDGECRAISGFPRVKLWQDAADEMGIDTSGLRRVRPQMLKYNLPVCDRFVREPRPIRWVYLLNTYNVSRITFDAVRGMDRFEPLYRNTYRVRFLENMALTPHHLRLCGKLAGCIRMKRIVRPDQGFHVDALVDRILADVMEPG